MYNIIYINSYIYNINSYKYMYIHLLYMHLKAIINYKYLCTLIPAYNLFQSHLLKKISIFFNLSIQV